MPECSRILVPVDPARLDALQIAAQIARQHDATVVYSDVLDAMPTASSRSELGRQKEQITALADARARNHGIKTSDHVALRGDLHLHVGAEIIRAARNARCFLIMMASHVPGIKDHVLSSNAGYVASHAPVSVHVIR